MTIYTIMTCEHIMEYNDTGFPEFGAARVPGFYTNYDDAVKALHNNSGDLREEVYDYAAIETVDEGLYGAHGSAVWFKFDKEKGGFYEFQTPILCRNICGLTIG